MKDKIIIIGANEFQEPLVLKAKELGYETHVFAWEEGSVAKKHADFFYPISIVEKEKIFKIAKKINPKGIVSIGSDLAVITVNYLINKLNLNGNSIETGVLSTNKYEMIKAFEKNNVSSPKYIFVKDIMDIDPLKIKYPVIVKPVDRSGSRGVFKITNPENLLEHAKQSIDISFKKEAIIEEFIDGKEYSVEMISYNGEHKFLAITEKFTTGEPNFIETMHFQPAIIDNKIRDRIIKEVKKGLNSLKIKNGASHSELKIDKNNKIKIIEIGSRMGGDCIGSDLVRISTGYDFLKMAIDISTGKEPNLKEITNHSKVAFIKFIFGNKDLHILNKIKEYHPNSLVRYEITGEVETRKVTDSSTRFGYYILKGSRRDEVLKIAEIDV